MNTNETELQKSTSYEEGVKNEDPEPQDLASEDVNKPVSIVSICHEKLHLITARVHSMAGGGGVLFSQVSVCLGAGEGLTKSPYLNTLLVPCPFWWGDIPVTGPRSFLGIPQSQVLFLVSGPLVFLRITKSGILVLGYPLARIGLGYPLTRTGLGTPLTRTGLGTPLTRAGLWYPPPQARTGLG